MKYFRFLLSVFFAGFMAFSFVAFPAHAASNTDAILASLREGVAVNGKTVELPSGYINQAENFFASHKISDAQAQYILAEIAGAKTAIRQAGVTDLKKMDSATRDRVLTAAQASANDLDLKLTVGSDKNVKIADSDGRITFSTDNVIKTTGPAIGWRLWTAVWSGLFLSALGMLLWGVHSKRLLEKRRT